MARKYHNLAGLVRDLEHAVEAGGAPEWDLLSRLDNMLAAIEEDDGDSSVGDSTDVDDADAADGDERAQDDADEHQLELLTPVPGVRPQVASPPSATRCALEDPPVPLVGADAGLRPRIGITDVIRERRVKRG